MCIFFTFDPYGMIIRMFHGVLRAIEYMQLDANVGGVPQDVGREYAVDAGNE